MTFIFKAIRKIIRVVGSMSVRLLLLHPYFGFIPGTRNAAIPITFSMWFRQNIIGTNYGPYWPVHPASMVTGWKNIHAGIDTCPGYMPGCYIQGIGKIYIGDYTRISANVGIISSNHLPEDLTQHQVENIKIGRYCWISMGAIILPGVELGDFTIVGAGSIVTKSFPEGHCVIAGNPALEIRKLDSAQCIAHKNKDEYHGFISKKDFEAFREITLYV